MSTIKGELSYEPGNTTAFGLALFGVPATGSTITYFNNAGESGSATVLTVDYGGSFGIAEFEITVDTPLTVDNSESTIIFTVNTAETINLGVPVPNSNYYGYGNGNGNGLQTYMFAPGPIFSTGETIHYIDTYTGSGSTATVTTLTDSDGDNIVSVQAFEVDVSLDDSYYIVYRDLGGNLDPRTIQKFLANRR